MRRQGSPFRQMLQKRSGADGFSMVELMMALFVLAVMMSAVAAALATAMRTSRGNTNRIVGANLASEQLDGIREQRVLGSFVSLAWNSVRWDAYRRAAVSSASTNIFATSKPLCVVIS